MTTQNRQKSNAKKTTPKTPPKENKMFDQTFIRFHYTPNFVYTGVMVISCSRRCWSLGWAVGEMLCLKLLQQFWSHLNEACYTWSSMACRYEASGQKVPELCPFFEILIILYPYFLWQSGDIGILTTINICTRKDITIFFSSQ